jgi:hypothetical protein
MMFDPLVSFHSVPENDNGAMDVLIKQGFGSLTKETNAAVEVFHHPGKPKLGQGETTVEDGRGASAILWAVRSARVLNFMTPEDANRLGIAEAQRHRHIRIANGKANMGPIGTAKWIKIEVENLPNGDAVACSSPWNPPNPFDGITSGDVEQARELARTGAYRADVRSPKWFGWALAEQLHIQAAHGAENDPKDIAKLKSIIAMWLKNRVLATEERHADDSRKRRLFIVPGSYKIAPSSDDLEDSDAL